MAAALNNLKRLDFGGTTGEGQDSYVTFWGLATTDAVATVETAGWWNIFAPYLRKGDIVLASMVRSGTPVAKKYICTVRSETAVTMAVAEAA